MGFSLFKHTGASFNDKLKPPDTGFLFARVLKAPEKILLALNCFVGAVN